MMKYTPTSVKKIPKSRSRHLACLLLTAVGIGPLSAQTNVLQDGGFELGIAPPGVLAERRDFYGAWTAEAGLADWLVWHPTSWVYGRDLIVISPGGLGEKKGVRENGYQTIRRQSALQRNR